MENKEEIKLKYFDEFFHKLANLIIRWIGGELNCSLDELYEQVDELSATYIKKRD